MKILVLGGTRFFGTHLVESLIKDKHDVIVATRGNQDFSFKNKVQFEKADRNNLEDLKRLAKLGPFDLIFDQICMSAKNAHDACVAFKGVCTRYVFTSTGSVYDPEDELELTEDLFDQNIYKINLEDTRPYNYQEAKRQAEAVFGQMAFFPVVKVRFSIVLGDDDYTNRLKFHIDAIKNEEEIYYPNLMARIGFIRSDEAGKFLHFMGRHNYTGAVNAVSSGTITLFDLIAMIEKQTGKRARFAEEANDKNHSPFGFEQDFMMSNKLGLSLGYQFENLDDYIRMLIAHYLKN